MSEIIEAVASDPTVDDANGIIIDQIQTKQTKIREYGYDVYLPFVWNNYAIDSKMVLAGDRHALDRVGPRLSGVFYSAAWELCRRGILRPSVRDSTGPFTTIGAPGNGYSITPTGERWLASADPRLHIPTEPARLASILAVFSPKFGSGFNQRAQEAIKCYNALAYLACCAMCGAAAESILLAVAIDRRGDTESVLRDYRAGGGRTRVERSLLGQVGEPVSSRFHMFTDLLNYWRDDSSHGVASTIDEPEAFDALSRLMRFAHFVSDQWTVLTGKPPRS
jgi:hypothetical protein